MKLALVTYHDQGNFAGEGSLEDQRLLQFLKEKGLDIQFEIWNDRQVNWTAFEAIILKSPWDYFDRFAEFSAWLDLLEKKNVRVLNPVEIVRWNCDKRYLFDIEKSGLGIVPSRLLEKEKEVNLAPLFVAWQTETIVVKPVVSGGAKNTFSIKRSEIKEYKQKLTELLTEEAFLAQPFMPEIQTEGEWSLVFFGGKFSHCVLKVPKSGDFRVQHYFGGAINAAIPPETVRKSAEKLVQEFAKGCLYARVDGVFSQDEFKLMELELIEPLLYLQENETFYENYYQALMELLNSSK
ncbi:MAG TPA: hypothetical protein VK927_07550 [Adhaeribacter sp.]|nr:hypothetical protein [Adhaeribacter sp.]